MNIPRLLLAILVGFIFVFGTDFVIHTIWLKADYMASMQLWRTDPEMMTRFPWMIAGHFLCAFAFVLIWAIGFAPGGNMTVAVIYGVLMGLFSQVNTIIAYVVSPMPGPLMTKWFVIGIVQAVLLAVVTFMVYKPARPSV
jgi:hypothetical protein